MSKTYTIQAVPAVVDRALRQTAKLERKSLNTVVLEALARGLGLDAVPIAHSDLDFLIGTWQEDTGFDQAMVDFERVR